jgi:hypothetical protein
MNYSPEAFLQYLTNVEPRSGCLVNSENTSGPQHFRFLRYCILIVTTCVVLGRLSCNNGRSTQPYVVGCLWPRGVCSYHWLALTRLRSLASPRLTYIQDVRGLSTNSRRMPGYNLETGLSSLPTLCDTCSWYSVVNLRPNLLEIQDRMCVLHSKDLW